MRVRLRARRSAGFHRATASRPRGGREPHGGTACGRPGFGSAAAFRHLPSTAMVISLAYDAPPSGAGRAAGRPGGLAFHEPAGRARHPLRCGRAHEPHALRLPDDPDHRVGDRGHGAGGPEPRAHRGPHADVRRRTGHALRAPRHAGRGERIALRGGEREPLGARRHRQPPRAVRARDARRAPRAGAARGSCVGGDPAGRVVRGRVRARRHFGRGGRALRRAGVRRGPHLGGGHGRPASWASSTSSSSRSG